MARHYSLKYQIYIDITQGKDGISKPFHHFSMDNYMEEKLYTREISYTITWSEFVCLGCDVYEAPETPIIVQGILQHSFMNNYIYTGSPFTPTLVHNV